MKGCTNCGSIIGRNSSKYCSNQCQLDYQYKQYITKWLSGEVDGVLAFGVVSKHIKRYLRTQHNNKCQLCGWAEINPHTGIIPLEVEHTDGNYKNNSIENLKLICPNCHSLTSTYKALNRGNGRPR